MAKVVSDKVALQDMVASKGTSSIISLCLFYTTDGDRNLGYIGNPSRTSTEGHRCPDIHNKIWTLKDTFYVINPMLTPIPVQTFLICAKRSLAYPYNTISISTAYDPYNNQADCVYFCCWIQPIPHTSPLYFYDQGKAVLPSFEFDPNRAQIRLSPLYVLRDSKIWKKKDGVPQFLFKQSMGRCIPDPKGENLEKCMVANRIEHRKPKDLLQYIKEKESSSNWFASLFETMPPVITSIAIIVLIVSLVVLVYILLTDKK